jgi:hypothetical protein
MLMPIIFAMHGLGFNRTMRQCFSFSRQNARAGGNWSRSCERLRYGANRHLKALSAGWRLRRGRQEPHRLICAIELTNCDLIILPYGKKMARRALTADEENSYNTLVGSD